MPLPRRPAGPACRALLLAAAFLAAGGASRAGVRIKDITDLEGARGNQLVGIGLVVGLQGTGGKDAFTQQRVADMLRRFNINIAKGEAPFKSGNVSVVMVTAELGPFVRRGAKIDIHVSALDDATSLHGGILLRTPLQGADRRDYAVAQGPVLVAGFSFGTSNGASPTATAQKNHPTVGLMPGGAIVEEEARGNILCNGAVRLMLRDADYGTATSIAHVINDRYPASAFALDPGTVQVFVPSERGSQVVAFVGEIGLLEVVPDGVARVVINERTGTVVAGHNVRISTVAVAHANLALVSNNLPEVSQPAPFSRGKTTVVPRSSLDVQEQTGALRVLDETVTVAEFARALNALGATPRDLVAIFKALDGLKALHARLVLI